MSKEAVRKYYAAFDENEWERLTWPEGVIEWAVTTHALQKHLPKHGTILDIGGGPGRYTIWLAQRGYRMVLADLSPNLLEIARKKIAEAGVQEQIEEVITGDVCDLGHFGDETFDAVLCLGPFYHLVEPKDREQAAQELIRVLKPGGKAFVAFMPLYTFLRRTVAIKSEQQHLAQPEFIHRLMETGVFWNDIDGRFTAGYGVQPQQVAPFMESHGFRTLALLADTGFAAALAQPLVELSESNPVAYKTVLDLIIQTAGDPSILGASIHLLYVGKKSGKE